MYRTQRFSKGVGHFERKFQMLSCNGRLNTDHWAFSISRQSTPKDVHTVLYRYTENGVW